MSDDPKGNNGLSAQVSEILRLQVEQSGELGGIRGELVGMNQHLRSIDARLDVGSSTIHSHGEQLVAHGEQLRQVHERITASEQAAQERRRRCSEQFKKLGRALEVTGEHLLIEDTGRKARSALWKKVAAGVGLAATLIGGGATLYECGVKHAASRVSAPDARR